MIIIGIDPGKSGAIIALNRDSRIVDKLIGTDPKMALNLLQCHPVIGHVFIEKAQCMPKNGAVGMFNYGKGYGELLGILLALGIPFTAVPPRNWSKEMTLGIPAHLNPKIRNLEAVNLIWPGIDLLASIRCKKPHEGLVDALLIAEYGRRNFKPQDTSCTGSPDRDMG